MCMPYKRMSCWRFKMKNSFASGQTPAHISANMSEGGWSEKGKQETQQQKKLESFGIPSTLDTTVLGGEVHPPELLESQAQSQHLCRSWGLAPFWLSRGSGFRRDPALEQMQSLFLAAKARHTAQLKTILNPGRARHKIFFFTQFPFCVRSRVVFISTQFVVLFNFI